jgi:hypothetical protein
MYLKMFVDENANPNSQEQYAYEGDSDFKREEE